MKEKKELEKKDDRRKRLKERLKIKTEREREAKVAETKDGLYLNTDM